MRSFITGFGAFVWVNLITFIVTAKMLRADRLARKSAALRNDARRLAEEHAQRILETIRD